MSSAQKHTPLPWYIMGIDEIADGVPAIEIMYGYCPSPQCETVAFVNCDIVDDELVITEKNEATAEFIVRACNSHYELVEALKLVMKNSSNFRLKAPDYMIDQIEAALEHATGKEQSNA